jgi:site-specific recombinase XerD
LRAYAADLTNYTAWCERHGFEPMPATPEIVGDYLAAAGEGYALPTLRRRVAAIARACGVDGHSLDTKHPAIRETLRGIARRHGAPARRSAALTTTEIKNLGRAYGTDLAGARDRALFLVGFAGAMLRSELVGLNVAHVTWLDDGMKLLIERSMTDAEGEGAEIAIPRGSAPEIYPVTALQQWLTAAEIASGPASIPDAPTAADAA